MPATRSVRRRAPVTAILVGSEMGPVAIRLREGILRAVLQANQRLRGAVRTAPRATRPMPCRPRSIRSTSSSCGTEQSVARAEGARANSRLPRRRTAGPRPGRATPRAVRPGGRMVAAYPGKEHRRRYARIRSADTGRTGARQASPDPAATRRWIRRAGDRSDRQRPTGRKDALRTARSERLQALRARSEQARADAECRRGGAALGADARWIRPNDGAAVDLGRDDPPASPLGRTRERAAIHGQQGARRGQPHRRRSAIPAARGRGRGSGRRRRAVD